MCEGMHAVGYMNIHVSYMYVCMHVHGHMVSE
jgi:hypothetical protein